VLAAARGAGLGPWNCRLASCADLDILGMLNAKIHVVRSLIPSWISS